MENLSRLTAATVIPGMRYRDAPAAIEWLCRAFGFERHLVVNGPNGTIAHAQLTLGRGMIMLGSGTNPAFEPLFKQPSEAGGETRNVYLVVGDADAVYAQAKAAGAEIVVEIKDENYGGRGFTCRDPEGHLWSIGTYDPWGTTGTITI
jgi:uncharacterized glyoxalase superfamily protein PhnB